VGNRTPAIVVDKSCAIFCVTYTTPSDRPQELRQHELANSEQ
jgi:hypothetical protein